MPRRAAINGRRIDTITPRTRRLLIGWLAPIAVVLAVVLVVWLAGGFKPAEALAGPRARLGEQLELKRWTVAVHRVALVDVGPEGYEQDPAFRIWTTLTMTGDETVSPLPDRLVEVRVPGGPQPGSPAVKDLTGGGLTFDPDVSRDVIIDCRWPDWKVSRQLPAPETIAIVINDEEWSTSYIWGRELRVGDPAGVITVPVDDQRERA